MPIVNNRLVSRFKRAAHAAAAGDGSTQARRPAGAAEGAATPAGGISDLDAVVAGGAREPDKTTAAQNKAVADAKWVADRRQAHRDVKQLAGANKMAERALKTLLASAHVEGAQPAPAATTQKSPERTATPSDRRRPPTLHQFKPGQSGNPGGRPKGSRNKVTRGALSRVVLEEAARAAPGPDGVSAHRAAVRTLFDKAAMGDMRAARLILPMAAAAENFVAELDDMAEAREAEITAEAEALERQAAYDELRRAEAAAEEALATQLAAEDPQVYKHARELMKPKFGDRPVTSFDKAVAQARVQIAIGQRPGAAFDPHLAAAALAQAQADDADHADDDDDGDE